MFSLIITIIGILLVAAVAIAAVFYGGSGFTSNGTKAAAAKVVNEGQQVRGAANTYRVQQGVSPASIDSLISTEYLTVPIAGWGSFTDYAATAVLSVDQCIAANKLVHVTGVPACSDPAYSAVEVCCQM